MKTLGVDNECAYPGFSDDPLDGFRHLLSDLKRFGDDFLSVMVFFFGELHKRNRDSLMSSITNLSLALLEIGDLGRAKNYLKVIELLESLEYPKDLSFSESRMLEIAKKRAER